MKEIQLENRKWYYDEANQLGPAGGFGAVYRGTDAEAAEVAIKRLKLSADQAAHRELRIAEELCGKDFRHVVPVLDWGQDPASGRYFVVMPLADKSLADDLADGASRDDAACVNVLLQIADGLDEVDALVHRDLKPGNILWLREAWAIADFGIARFVEEATSANTVKNCLSPQYAAPEQWRGENTTHATDIYALGCVGYTLILGHPPFLGRGMAEYEHQHLYGSPPGLEDHSPRLDALLRMMVRKNPEVRPPLDRVRNRLDQILDRTACKHRCGLAALAEVGAKEAQRAAEAEATEAKKQAEREKRHAIAEEAYSVLHSVMVRLFGEVQDAAPTCKVEGDLPPAITSLSPTATLRLRNCLFRVTLPSIQGIVPVTAFSRSGWNIILGATLGVVQNDPEYEWLSSLWFGDVNGSGSYRWWEVSYMTNPVFAGRQAYEPFAIQDHTKADEAAAQKAGKWEIAYGPKPIDGEDARSFCDKWAGRIAKGCEGKLCAPNVLPMNDA